MKLTPYSLEQLKEIILGEEKELGYLKGGQLVELFNKVGVRDVYNYNNGEGLPNKWSRKVYIKEKLKQLNEKQELKQLLEILIPFKKENCSTLDTDEVFKQINEIINNDGYELKSVNGIYEISSLKKSNISNKLEKREPKMYYSIYIETSLKIYTNLDISSKEELISTYLEPYLNNEYFLIDGTKVSKSIIRKILVKETDFSLKEEAKKREKEDKNSNEIVMCDMYLGKNIGDILIKELENKNKEKKEMNENKKRGDKVFIVHGHDNGLKEEVARFVEKLGLEVIILHEQLNKGKTIIEKFEEYANEIGYAIILYTPCDKGYSIKEGDNNIKSRARQNVILEHGFFIGKLGRECVAAIKKDNVEVPSDLDGILYINHDIEGAWKFQLAREMKGIGFNIDFNHII
ncbi:nucleotide-binding protein [Fusobacterium animalis]|uniref:nucleotide-binding protein n=1 Tax=Fusobacterium animalis TaxID=76859 RepID=UPI0030CAD297